MLRFVFGFLAVIAALGGVYAMGRSHSDAVWRPKLAEAQRLWKSDMDACARNIETLNGAIQTRNAEIETQSREASAKLAGITRELELAQRGQEAAQQRVAHLMRPLTGKDQCARVLEADKRLLETLG